MNKSRHFLSLTALSLLLLAGPVFAQTEVKPQAEPNYEVALQVIIGSNDAISGVVLPDNLSPIARQLKSNFSFSNYRLVNTFLGRIANTGQLEYKSVSNILGQESDAESHTFLDWSLNGFKTMPNSSGQTAFQVQNFRFGARVPIRTGSFKDESGKLSSVINYESIGLTMVRVGLPENNPTLMGTLSLPRTNGTAFLVLTIKSVKENVAFR